MIVPSLTSTRWSFTHADVMLRRVRAARSMPTLMASSKDLSDVALISVMRATFPMGRRLGRPAQPTMTSMPASAPVTDLQADDLVETEHDDRVRCAQCRIVVTRGALAVARGGA